MLTRRCNMQCAHCSVESGPKTGTEGPPLADLLEALRSAAASGVDAVNVTGGEPMLREREVLEVLRECCRLGMATRMTTNGFWGRTPERARRTLTALIDSGIGGMTVSYDRFHAAFQGPEPVVNIARAAAESGFMLDVNVTRLADDEEIEELVAPFAILPGVRLRFYDVQPVGAARNLPGFQLRSEVEGFCNACGVPALTDDGRVTACNGPSYFLPPDNPLAIGSLSEAPLGELLARHRDDPILETIRTEGPNGLRNAMLEIPGIESFEFRARYSGMCDLCHHITSSPAAVAALRVALASPGREAQRVARRRVIEVERMRGQLTRMHTNTVGSARTLLALAAGEALDAAVVSRVLGRADLDWRARAESMIAAGLARPLVEKLDEPILDRWAPALFGSRIRRAAVADDERMRVQRESLKRLAEILRARHATGTIVGGAALWPWGRVDSRPQRAVGEIEVVVRDPHLARLARARIAEGVAMSGIEIRTRIAPKPWGLPDGEILEAARPLPEQEMQGLLRLTRSDALLCALVTASAEGLRMGLETIWDAHAALRGEPVDVERIFALVASLPAPRSFWVPARVLAARAGVPIPAELLSRAPDDLRQRRLERLAGRRLYRVRSANRIGEWSFRWAWPVLASGSAFDFGRRLPSAIARAARDLPSAWSEVGAGGVAGAVREARRMRRVWSSNSEPG
jgi:pyruvate-formate lyase-activating enzyme